jgi:hypothetical protein
MSGPLIEEMGNPFEESTMPANKQTNDLIADFRSRVEDLKRDGVPDFPPLGGRLPWAEATEERKLVNIVWESMALSLHDGDQSITSVPGLVALDVVEKNIDYAKLPEGHRECLQELRGSPPEGSHDPIAGELQRLAGLELNNDDDHELDGPTFEELAEEIRQDQHAARVRDYGEADAATYVQRIKEGADTVRHLEPDVAGRDDWMAKLSIDDQSRKELAAELDLIKRDTYVQPEEQFPGWNFTRGDGGYPFRELPVVERESLVEDYVDWGKYRERGLTFEDQSRVMHEAARDPVPSEILASHQATDSNAEFANLVRDDATPLNSEGNIEMNKPTVESERDRDERLKYLVFKGAPMPEGWKLPALIDPPDTSSPQSVQRSTLEIETLKAASFESWRQVPFDAGSAAEPGHSGRWTEMTEFGKLDTLQHWINWEGVSKRDRASMMADLIDVEKLSPDLRTRLTADAGRSSNPADYQQVLDAGVPARFEEADSDDKYRIWQANDPSAAVAGWSAFPSDYRPVIEVETESLKDAYEFTNSGAWWEAWEVNVIADNVRSTTVGDVIVAPDGYAHRIKPEGFDLVDPAKERSKVDEPPLERVERQLRDWKHDHSTDFRPDPATGRMGPGTHRWLDDAWVKMSESDKLRVLEGELDWGAIGAIDDRSKEVLLAREVDFSKISRDQLNSLYEDVFMNTPHAPDERPARRLFDVANYARAVAAAYKAGDFDEQLTKARPTTRNLIEAVMLDTWPRAAAVVDFGLDSQTHYESLYYPIRNEEIPPAVLDAAMGQGEKLTELARNAPSNPHKNIMFHTSWDELLGRDRPEGTRREDAQAKPQSAYEKALDASAECGSHNDGKDKTRGR